MGRNCKRFHSACGAYYPRILIRALCINSIFVTALYGPLTSATRAEDLVPKKSTWLAEASAVQNERLGAELAIDGEPTTRWSSPFADGHWLQIDLGHRATVTGAILQWENAYASKYRILYSDDAKTWQTCCNVEDGDGQIDQLYFRPTTARF